MTVRMRSRQEWHNGGLARALDAGQVYDLPVVVAQSLVALGYAESWQPPAHEPDAVAMAVVPETGRRRKR